MVEIVFPVGSYRTTGTKSNMSECVLSFQLKSLQLWPNDLSSTVCFICCCCWCFFLFFTAVHNLCVWDTSQQEAVSPLLWDCFVEPQELPQSPSGSIYVSLISSAVSLPVCHFYESFMKWQVSQKLNVQSVWVINTQSLRSREQCGFCNLWDGSCNKALALKILHIYILFKICFCCLFVIHPLWISLKSGIQMICNNQVPYSPILQTFSLYPGFWRLPKTECALCQLPQSLDRSWRSGA